MSVDRGCCVASVVPVTPSTAICSGLPVPRGPAILSRMGTKSRETIYGASVRAAAERAAEARKEADRLACEAWNKRMLGFQGPAQPSPALGDAINAGFGYLEVKCLGCNTHQTVALDIVRRPKATPIHELERYMRCKDCSRASRAIRTSAAIWWRCARPRSRRAIRRRRGGRENGSLTGGYKLTTNVCTSPEGALSGGSNRSCLDSPSTIFSMLLVASNRAEHRRQKIAARVLLESVA